jgi:hypothetical protein
VLQAGEVRGEEVGDGEPELAAEGAALGEADIADAEGWREEAVDPDLS